MDCKLWTFVVCIMFFFGLFKTTLGYLSSHRSHSIVHNQLLALNHMQLLHVDRGGGEAIQWELNDGRWKDCVIYVSHLSLRGMVDPSFTRWTR